MSSSSNPKGLEGGSTNPPLERVLTVLTELTLLTVLTVLTLLTVLTVLTVLTLLTVLTVLTLLTLPIVLTVDSFPAPGIGRLLDSKYLLLYVLLIGQGDNKAYINIEYRNKC
jgi:sensor histidine kinase YesM